jgi:hypothetical protein
MRHDTHVSAKVASFPRNPELLPVERLTDVELADQFGEFDRRYQGCADRRKHLMDELKRRCDSQPADESIRFPGSIWDVTVGVRGMQTSLPPMSSIHRMFRAAKKDFYAAISMTQDAFKEALGKETFESLKARTQTGYRRVEAVLKIQPKAS